MRCVENKIFKPRNMNSVVFANINKWIKICYADAYTRGGSADRRLCSVRFFPVAADRDAQQHP